MHDALKNFEKRHREVQNKHHRLSQGYVTRVGRNGVIEHRPRRDYSGWIVTPLLILGVAFFAIKALFMSRLGAEAYSGHLDTLAAGGLVERIGALAMQPDPISRMLADTLTQLF